MLMFGVRVGKRSYLCAASYREAFNTPIPNLTNETYPNLTGVFAIEYRHEVISRVHGIVSLGAGSSASDSTVLRRGGYVARFSSSRMWIPHASLGAAWTGDGKPISFVIEGRIAALGNPYSGGELIVIPSFRVGLYFTNH
ncbi:MAG: hypothetical protein JNL32_06160, partial [Candidatus Kapabacteria bacterium]|nr:hypothetical protein [Candidatus Kapabacteria bacterium]